MLFQQLQNSLHRYLQKVIVVGADKMSSIINYEDRATCIIFGDIGAIIRSKP